MSNEEAAKRISAYITCLKCEISGKECDVNCPVEYEAGTMGEIVEALETVIESLKAEPQIIWCKDCRYYKQFGKSEWGDCLALSRICKSIDFCSWGARMDSEQILSEADNDTAYGGLMSAT